MTCHSVEIHTVLTEFPEGGGSHGPTCCQCGRELPFREDEDGNVQRYRIFVQAEAIRWHAGPDKEADFERAEPRHPVGFQVCSETCVGPIAIHLFHYIDWEERRGTAYRPLCPAHDCVEIVQVARNEPKVVA